MLKQLSGLDAMFLYMETPRSFGHVASLTVFDRPTPQFQPYEAVRQQIESRLELLEPYRRKLATVPLELDHPYWVNDPDFDLDFHVREMGLARPGSDAQLADQVARIVGRPLDRSRPLWEVYVIDGLEGDRFAFLNKVHHATIDGASGSELLEMLLDTTADATATESTPAGATSAATTSSKATSGGSPAVARPATDRWRADTVPSTLEMFWRGLGGLARRPDRVVRVQARLVRELGAGRGTALGEMFKLARPFLATVPGLPSGRRSTEPARDTPPELPTSAAPETPFNRSITPHRRVALGSAPLATVKALKSAYGVTVNDIVMSVCAGALRRYLADHEALPAEPLVAMVPVSIRTGAETQKWTNRVSALFAPIPTHLDDPAERVRFMNQAMIAAKGSFDLIPAETLADLTQFAPPALATRAIRMATSARLGNRLNGPVNLVISNVPGPRQPLYLGGARLAHFYPVSTIVEGQGLNITVQSYLDTLDFGLVACRELVPDLDVLLGYLLEEIDVLAAAQPSAATPTIAEPAPVEPALAKPTPAKRAPNKRTSPAKTAPAGPRH